ncbi:unnamed protein product, partial [Urochloa humidicola]
EPHSAGLPLPGPYPPSARTLAAPGLPRHRGKSPAACLRAPAGQPLRRPLQTSRVGVVSPPVAQPPVEEARRRGSRAWERRARAWRRGRDSGPPSAVYLILLNWAVPKVLMGFSLAAAFRKTRYYQT